MGVAAGQVDLAVVVGRLRTLDQVQLLDVSLWRMREDVKQEWWRMREREKERENERRVRERGGKESKRFERKKIRYAILLIYEQNMERFIQESMYNLSKTLAGAKGGGVRGLL